MKVCELVFNEKSVCGGENTLFSTDTEFGRITVLDRLTGYGDGDIRDIETGYKNKSGEFWLASGDFDIRRFGELTIEDAVLKIKENANTCRGNE